MKTLIRLYYLFLIWSLERQFDDELTCMRQCSDTYEFMRIYRAHQETRKELAAARAGYNALFPVGQRKTWANA